MKLNWFRRIGILYVPISPIGYLIAAAVVVYGVWVFRDIDSRSHSVSDTLINFVFNMLLVGVAYSVVGYLTERKN